MSIEDKFKTVEDFNRAIDFARNAKAQAVYETLLSIKDLKFEKGDILIKQELEWDDDFTVQSWVTEKFSKTNCAPRKYEIIFVDEVGLPYVSKISMNSKYCGDIRCVAGYDLGYTRFCYDPDFLDHQILAEEDENFDPQQIYKEKRDEHFKTRPKRKTKQTKVLDEHSGRSVTTVS